MKVDAVFEGGGIKGLAYIGAIEIMEEAGYKWERLAGTSVGSIVASLLAVGYNAKELKRLMIELPFEKIEKKTTVGNIPIIGSWLSLSINNGIYRMTILEEWLNMALKAKGIRCFGDLPENKLKIVITDLSRNRMSILPDDLPLYNVDPKSFPIASAVLMSNSIPFFFIPSKLNGNVIVDGGVLSNYPIWIFDVDGMPRWPTIGFRLSGPSAISQPSRVNGPVKTTLAIIRTMLEAHDKKYINSHNATRTVFIKNIDVGATDFNISNKQKFQLIELGRNSTYNFIKDWKFINYVKQYRI
ncbi:patatin-like phospholipase family protein [Aquibacillus sp. 3ASR75-11]|uniref:Patatin-like phospholipase family protein n=1 Tax=Terrihalobacillus insolitus TaxID=2950438 RepID=A0A9X3WX88_9BACI|nr:patatin-like phospholipase family protein [Terrihalobacillus insolitus]MDC3415274.1 patatin-like phospholipase family protein [Terrihalobacillus insolitus]MDC3425896.1 patatin-like phospholipase family protein [Terrihalobacillus insolitus]